MYLYRYIHVLHTNIYIYYTYTFAMIPRQDILTFGSFEGPSPTLVGASPVTWSFPFHFSLKAKYMVRCRRARFVELYVVGTNR